MKILALSMLRLGDIVMSTAVIRGLRSKYPDSEIHLLINKQFAGITPLLAGVDHVHFFDRDRMQASLADPDRPFFEARNIAFELIDKLNDQKFDLMVNLTQNRLSGWLMGAIDATEKQGLVLDDQGLPVFGSVWFRYLNSNAYHQDELVFHFTDIFKFALDLDARKTRPHLVETTEGMKEALEWLRDSKEFIVVQPLTSDSKKNWPLKRFLEAMEQIHCNQPKYRFLVLGSPSEKAELEKWRNLWPSSLPAELAICSLAASYSILKRASLLITGDTSIKHMAAATSSPVLEVALGSGDPNRTGIYSDKGFIVQSKEACFPCQHRSACHRDTHACAKSVESDVVAMSALQILSGNEHQLAVIAEEYSDGIDILKTDISTTDFWKACTVRRHLSVDYIARMIEMSSWKLLLNEASGRSGPVGEYGSESYRLARWLQKIFPAQAKNEIVHLLSDFEEQTSKLERRLNGVEFSLRDYRIK